MIRNIIVLADLHIGDRWGLCTPPSIFRPKMDEGSYTLSPGQRKLWKMFQYFWDEWVPKVTRKEKLSAKNCTKF